MRLSHLVGLTSAAMRHSLETAMAEHGATFPEFLILHVVATQPGLSQRELADRVGLERATMSHHLERLQAAGLVTRARDPLDRRILRVGPTAAGRRRLARLDAIVERLEDDLHAQLTQREATMLHRVLERLAVSMDAGGRRG